MAITDHDLLIQLGVQIKQVRVDIKDLADGTSLKVSDHESRIRRLEMWGFMAIGALAFIELVIGYLAVK
jgi:hypothetical protein